MSPELNPQAITARALSEALPYLQRYRNARIVVKFGGNAIDAGGGNHAFAKDIALMAQVGMHPVVVHGGGPQIDQMLARLQIQSHFVDGLRVTNAEAINIIEMVLAGQINREIVGWLQQAGANAIGLSGKDGYLIAAQRMPIQTSKSGEQVDYGFVGQPTKINVELIEKLLIEDLVPVIAPLGAGARSETYNINADTVAGAVAGALEAERLLLLTNVPGVLNKQGELLSELTIAQVHALMADGTIAGGMIPKVQTCIDAIAAGVKGAVILDGRVPHALLLEILTEGGAGTLITP